MPFSRGPWTVNKTNLRYKSEWVEVSEDQIVRPGCYEGTFTLCESCETGNGKQNHSCAKLRVDLEGEQLAKTMSRFLTIAVFTILAVPTAWAQQLPKYEVARVTTPLSIDGQLTENAWQQAADVGPFLNNRDASPNKVATQARILYDDTYLYFAFRAVDKNIWATMKRRDEHLWLEEVVEVFLQPSSKIPNYIELEVNALGTMLDIYLLDTRKPLHYESWNSDKLRWAVHVDGTVDGKDGDREWTCEIALPLEEAVTAANLPPKPGDRWRMNLFRVERQPEVAELSWSPTLQDDFHVLSRLGEIVFTDRTVPK